MNNIAFICRYSRSHFEYCNGCFSKRKIASMWGHLKRLENKINTDYNEKDERLFNLVLQTYMQEKQLKVVK